MVDLKRTTIEIGALKCDVFYLLAHSDETPASDPYARAPIAPGKARFWMEKEKTDVAAGLPPDSARRQVEIWNRLSDLTWPSVCSTLGDKLLAELPNVDAFCVVPSSRESIRAPLVASMWARFATARELIYSKPAAFFFGGSPQTAIAAALVREDTVSLPDPATVLVVDDWCGNGTTFRALAERIGMDHPDRALTFVGAFPGISAPTFAGSDT